MSVLVSACLVGRNCKYNGGNNYDPKVVEFLKGKEVVEYCPEVEAGFGIPRVPMEIVEDVLTNRDGIVLDEAMRRTVQQAVEKFREMDIDCAVLKSRSPTCGVRQVYDGSFSGKLVSGQGIFARALMEAGIRVIDAEEL